jgi:hypothetical protein
MSLISNPRLDSEVIAAEKDIALLVNSYSLFASFKVAENMKWEESYLKQPEQSREAWLVRKTFENDKDQKLLMDFAKKGLYLDSAHGPGFDGLSPEHARQVSRGDKIMLNNGHINARAGVIFADVQELRTALMAEGKTAWDVLMRVDEEAKEFYAVCEANS